MSRRLFFLLVPGVHALDLAGPLQTFYEANGFGADYRIGFCACRRRVRTAQGLEVAGLEKLPEVGPDDVVLVPGLDSSTLDDLGHVPVDWLRAVAGSGATLGSICSGAFVLGHAGLLDGRTCTTHWKVAERLQRRHPAARVLFDRLYVQDGRVITSAGVTSGIDMALSMVERDHGPQVTANVAREMVVYLRRDGQSSQSSVFLDYRRHLHPGVHRVQDWLLHRVKKNPTLPELARIAGMSERNLTRVFRRATGITLKEFSTRVKLEVAKGLLRNPAYTLERVAAECGFNDSRQLRRLWTRSFGESPSAWRHRNEGRATA